MDETAHPNRLNRPLAIGAIVVLVAAFAYLAYGGMEDNLVYFLTPSELVAKGEKAIDRQGIAFSSPLCHHLAGKQFMESVAISS